MAQFKRAEKFILNQLQKKLPKNLLYHGYHHTIDVMAAAIKIAAHEKLSAAQISLLRVAVAFHDAGYLHTYKNHEQKGCVLAEKNLPQFNFTAAQISAICSMIMATKIPQVPKTKTECIICDADLDYLGTNKAHKTAQALFNELKLHGRVANEKAWNKIQIEFLKKHTYHTAYSIKYRQAKKQQYLRQVISSVEKE